MSDKMFRTEYGAKTFSPVGGQMPPLASEAPMTAKDSVVVSMEHDYKAHKNVTQSRLPNSNHA